MDHSSRPKHQVPLTTRNYVLQLVLCLLLAVSIAFAQSRDKRVTPVESTQANRFDHTRTVGVAVLVGVGIYPRFSGLSQLRYPSRDVDLLGAALEKQRYIVLRIKDSEATKAAVLNVISQAGEALAGENFNFIFFFSGHGFAVSGTNYLATQDADSNGLASSGLSIDAVEKAMKATGASRRVMWIDACRDEPGVGTRGVNENRGFAALQESEGTRSLLSTKAGKLSYEDDGLKQGTFSYYLVKGIEGNAAGEDGLVTFEDLASYVTAEVRTYSLKQGHVQVPYETGEHSGDFLLARTSSKLPPPVPDIPAPHNPRDVSPNSADSAIKSQMVSRGVQVVNYQNYSGWTHGDFRGTSLEPRIKGAADISSEERRTEVKIHLKDLPAARKFGALLLTYVLWGVTPDGHASNLGEVVINSEGDFRAVVTTDLRAFGLIVTAEPYFAVSQPSDVVVAENVISTRTSGEVTYDLLPRGEYEYHLAASMLKPVDLSSAKMMPLELYEAMNAIQIAQYSKADQFAADSFKDATRLLQQAQDYSRRKQWNPAIVASKESVKKAEDARALSQKRQREAH